MADLSIIYDKLSIMLRCAFCLLLMSLCPAISWAQPITIQLTDTPSHRTLAYFANREVVVPVRVAGITDSGTQLHAQLVQLTSALETVIIDAIPVPLGGAKESRTEIITQIMFRLPNVKRETEFALRVYAISAMNDNPLRQEWRIRAYPPDIQDTLRQWSEKVQLRVMDERGVLRNFLEAYRIKFEDYRSPARESLPVVMVAVHSGERTFRRERFIKPGQQTIIFHEKADPLTHVLVKQAGAERTIDVHMHMLDALENSPRAQHMLLAIFQMTND